jgi:hypothetical protein
MPCHCNFSGIYEGVDVNNKHQEYVGKTYSTHDGDVEVIEYENYRNVKVRFVTTKFETFASMDSIKRGKVKDRMKPSVFGVGFIGGTECSPTKNGRLTKCYRLWQAILKRCYCEKSLAEKPYYRGVKVCNEWHNFQNFASWFEKNSPSDIDKYHLDKDRLQKGDVKVYSPSTCCFITPQENSELACAKEYKFTSPNKDDICVYNLRKFCREQGLHYNTMIEVSSGSRNSHKGWTINETTKA